MKKGEVSGSREHGFMKGKSSLTKLIVFCGEVMDEGRLGDVFILTSARLLSSS